jgi:hypothetical protein
MARVRSHLTFANVVSLMALFVALTPKTATATCPAGKRAVGGGATHSNAAPGLVVIDQIQPSDEHTVPGVVTVGAYETGTTTSWSVTAFALCANVP